MRHHLVQVARRLGRREEPIVGHRGDPPAAAEARLDGPPVGVVHRDQRPQQLGLVRAPGNGHQEIDRLVDGRDGQAEQQAPVGWHRDEAVQHGLLPAHSPVVGGAGLVLHVHQGLPQASADVSAVPHIELADVRPRRPPPQPDGQRGLGVDEHRAQEAERDAERQAQQPQGAVLQQLLRVGAPVRRLRQRREQVDDRAGQQRRQQAQHHAAHDRGVQASPISHGGPDAVRDNLHCKQHPAERHAERGAQADGDRARERPVRPLGDAGDRVEQTRLGQSLCDNGADVRERALLADRQPRALDQHQADELDGDHAHLHEALQIRPL
mmetsp:Transcript_62501/g.191170  ORF Transcript_62501/g.191170 Transcript_62501/m.191170 type:complete len:324 (-) Transcript_62501:397-1368(-)